MPKRGIVSAHSVQNLSISSSYHLSHLLFILYHPPYISFTTHSPFPKHLYTCIANALHMKLEIRVMDDTLGVRVDGVDKDPRMVSRQLTGTTFESGNGIFNMDHMCLGYGYNRVKEFGIVDSIRPSDSDEVIANKIRNRIAVAREWVAAIKKNEVIQFDIGDGLKGSIKRGSMGGFEPVPPSSDGCYYLSRIMTNTIREGADGIFTIYRNDNKCSHKCYFVFEDSNGNDELCYVEFNDNLSEAMSSGEIHKIVCDRANLVRDTIQKILDSQRYKQLDLCVPDGSLAHVTIHDGSITVCINDKPFLLDHVSFLLTGAISDLDNGIFEKKVNPHRFFAMTGDKEEVSEVFYFDPIDVDKMTPEEIQIALENRISTVRSWSTKVAMRRTIVMEIE